MGIAQLKMLRAILGRSRQVSAKPPATEGASSQESELENEEEGSTELVESWVHWKQRSTREVLGIIGKLQISEWPEQQRLRKWTWAGHVARRHDGRWSKKVLLWTPPGARRTGHPCCRWEDCLPNNWLVEAQGREEWFNKFKKIEQ